MNENTTAGTFLPLVPSRIDWSNLKTGHAEMDAEHWRLVRLLERLQELMDRGITGAELARIFTELRRYTEYHFSHEAELMDRYKVSEAHQRAHLLTHRGFARRLDQAALAANNDPTSVSKQLIDFLSRWLINHIAGMDRELIAEINAAGKPSALTTEETASLQETLAVTVGRLHDRIVERTFELVESNHALYQEKAKRQSLESIVIKHELSPTLKMAQSKLQSLRNTTMPPPNSAQAALMDDIADAISKLLSKFESS